VETQLPSGGWRGDEVLDPERPMAQNVRTRFIDGESVLLRYVLGNARSYVWAITGDRTTVHELPGRAAIERRVRQYTASCSIAAASDDRADGRKQSLGPDRDEASALGRLLLAPVAWALDRRRVLILADGVLQRLPFASLTHPRNGFPLIVHHEMVHLPSASHLVLQRGHWHRHRDWSRPVVVFADPVFSVADPRMVAVADRPAVTSASHRSDTGPDIPEPLAGALRDMPGFSGAAIPRLSGTCREAGRIKTLAPRADVFVGFQATRAAATNASLAKYRIVHFATHGIINDRDPERSGLILSLVDRSGRPQDGYLRLEDIRNLWLPVDLVVLSGCSMSLGDHASNVGVNGLVRSFLSAGSRRVIATLWRSDDRSTSALMAKFYRGLFDMGLTPPAALRAAQIELLTRSRWKRPFHWAAFVFQGEWT
jgi:CHAT domain-containing protein